MKSAVWTKAMRECADPHRARHFFQLLAATSAGPALQKCLLEQARFLAALFSGSRVGANLLVSHPEWLGALDAEALKFPRRKQGFAQEVEGWLGPLLGGRDYSAALARAREFKQRELLRIAARDLGRPGNASEITREISDLADVVLESVWRICWSQLTQRHGRPWHKDASGRWQPTAGSIIGLGKLGGQELNYSSDVDVIFVYSEEGNVFRQRPGAGSVKSAGADGSLTNHQFFNRLAEAFIAEVTRLAPEGALYRIDLRLRPEGDAGPLSRSLAGYENFYSQWGQTWERMMLIKARGVAGDGSLAAEFAEMVQPFRYPRSVNENVLREIAAIKDRIENEVVRSGELDRNVKLGRGGIREIEFIVQAMQLLHGGRLPFLQGTQTLPVLEKLARYELLNSSETRLLAEAYVFLRDLEHRLQMDEHRQTHTVPPDRPARERLARLMGCGTLKEFEAGFQAHTGNVRRLFDKVLKAEKAFGGAPPPFPREFKDAEGEWKELLSRHGFKEVDKAFRMLREFVEGPGYVHVSPRTSELALQLLPRLFEMCRVAAGTVGTRSTASPPPENSGTRWNASLPGDISDGRQEPSRILSDPDRVVTRLDSFISAYGARGTLFEVWNSNPAMFELLTLLFDRSEFLAEMAISSPDLVDALVSGGRLRRQKSAEETLRDLRHGHKDADQHLWLRRYHRAELMRIGLRDILGLADPEQYLVELSNLAEACLKYALEVVMRKNRLKRVPFVIIGLGKLGGGEIDYGSDLDIVFVADSKAKSLANLSRLAVAVMDLLSLRTEQGIVFDTDARLRPDGEKGLLVNTSDAFREYYQRRAQLWEIQSLTRARAVAGDARLADEFKRMAALFTNFKEPLSPLAAFSPDWKRRIHRMRMRIEKERTPPGKDELAIKTGKGGLMDAEFIAQSLSMANGWQEPNTLRALQRARDAGVLPAADKLIESYRRLRRVEGILRRWSYEGETLLPSDAAAYARVSVRCGFSTAGAFREAVAGWRSIIRRSFSKVFEA